MPTFIPGLPGEWRAFAERHEAFLVQQPALTQAANLLFRKLPPSLGGNGPLDAPGLTFLLVRQSAQDFQELLLLSANGYGLGAEKVLRGMFERIVTAAWFKVCPAESERFLNWELVQRGKAARAAIQAFGDDLGSERRTRMQTEVDRAEEHRSEFMMKCEQCGIERPAPGWSKTPFASMVQKVRLLRLIVPAYYEPLTHAHATAASLSSFAAQLKRDTPIVHREEAGLALRIAHFLFLIGLEAIGTEGDGEAEAAMKSAWASYEGVWKGAT